MKSPSTANDANTDIAVISAVTAMFLAGAMSCLSVLVIPVLLDTNTNAGQLAIQWARVYHYGHIGMPALCLGTTGLFLYAALGMRNARRKQWSMLLLAALTTVTMVPFTWIFMVPTNNELFQMESDALKLGTVPNLDETQRLVVRWAWLHAARTVFPFTGAIIGLTNATGKREL